MSAAATWDALSLEQRRRFLSRRGFPLIWAAHAWRTLLIEIQVSFEKEG